MGLTPEREAELRRQAGWIGERDHGWEDPDTGEWVPMPAKVRITGHEKLRDLLSEIDRLRAEVAEHELRARALRADVAECQEAADAEADEADRLRAEVAALREAGEGLARLLDLNVDHVPGGSLPEGDPEVTISLARWRKVAK